MTKNIVFPVNNKGGVGKTSILTDLCATLAQRHSVGIIDTDHQASLAATLLDNPDIACRELDTYDCSRVLDVTMLPEVKFSVGSVLSSTQLIVSPTVAKVGVFPAGYLYEYPKSTELLERILLQDMADAEFIAVDLPPIPYPSLLLDYTIKPMIDIIGKDVNLYPLLVSTPDHNVIDICLKQYEGIQKYFIQKGIPPQKIHPISILNKVPIKKHHREDSTFFYKAQIENKIMRKLSNMGMIHNVEDFMAGINHFNKKFSFNGKTYRSVFFPHIDNIQDGRFSILWGEQTQIYHFPHLSDLVKDSGYKNESDTDPIQRSYLYSLRKLTNYLVAKSNSKPRKNYIKKKRLYNSSKVTNEALKELQQVLEARYLSGKEKQTERVQTPAGHGSTSTFYLTIPKTASLEQTIDVVVRTQQILDPLHEVDREQVTDRLTDDRDYMKTNTWTLKDTDGQKVCSVTYAHIDRNLIRFGFPRPESKYLFDAVEPSEILPKIGVFISELSKIHK